MSDSFDQRLAACLGRCVPDFKALISCRRLSGGASQETYRVEIEAGPGPRTLAVRRAAKGIRSIDGTGPGLEGEADLFRVARAAGVPEPEIIHTFLPDDELGAGFVMQWLEGETLGGRIVRDPKLETIRPRLAFECGEILARIHGIDPVATGLARHLKTVSTRDNVTDVWERYVAFGTAMPMIDYTARWLLDHLPDEAEPRLVHNDFRNGNIMVSSGGVVAVLDWELAHMGDPVRDIGWICTNSWRFGGNREVGGFGDLADLLDGYESVSGVRIHEPHVRFWQIFGSYWWATASTAMAAFWRAGADRTVERPGIARRSSECLVDCANLIIPGPVELVQADVPTSSVDMPRVDELLSSVRDFLRDDLRGDSHGSLEGRNSFLALVASNSLDIVQRELTLGPRHLAAEKTRLRALFASEGSLESLRQRLCDGLRDGSIDLDLLGLKEHLRTTAANQVAIDQPKYSGLAEALAHSNPE